MRNSDLLSQVKAQSAAAAATAAAAALQCDSSGVSSSIARLAEVVQVQHQAVVEQVQVCRSDSHALADVSVHVLKLAVKIVVVLIGIRLWHEIDNAPPPTHVQRATMSKLQKWTRVESGCRW